MSPTMKAVLKIVATGGGAATAVLTGGGSVALAVLAFVVTGAGAASTLQQEPLKRKKIKTRPGQQVDSEDPR
jgi:hypothetical protein